MIGTLILCFLIADFITGILHWIEDTYGLPSWPILGKTVIFENIRHHKDPTWIARMHGLFFTNYQQVIASILCAIPIFYFWGQDSWPILFTLLIAGFGNEFHAWSHMAYPPKWVKFLQDACIVQHPRQHAKHHRKPYDRYFCVMGNIPNEILERINFWRGLEWIIFKVFGIKPKRGSEERQGV